MHENNTRETRYLLGVVGDDASLRGFWSVLNEHLGGRGMRDSRFVAAALPESAEGATRMDLGLGVPVYVGFREMLYLHPEINLVIETTGDPALLRTLRKTLPERVTLVERAAASFFVRLFTGEERCLACKVDQQQTEALMNAVVDQLGADILYLDADGVVLHANQTFCDAEGLSKREAVGRNHAELLPCLTRPWEGADGGRGEAHDKALGQAHDQAHGQAYDQAPPGETPFQRALRQGAPVETLSTQVDPEGRMRHFRLYFYPVARGPELARVVLIRRDITRRTELEQRLTHSQKMASIGELSTYIAHEIRNPVFAIAGFANALLRDEAIGDSSREKLRIILEESRRLDEILKAIINFARPVDPGGSSCDAAAVAREALYAVLSGSGLGRVETTINLAPGLPRTAIDPDLLKQCLINLIVNSREAMPEGGKLRLGARLEGGRVAVSVEDTGAGIPPDIRDKIFSPFFSTKGRVAGLGLAMARKIMEDIGGAVELASSPGKGTSVTLLLPPVLAVAQSAPTA